jgi:predicted rRNA methylase YqxC with S4 and FtsJ domains
MDNRENEIYSELKAILMKTRKDEKHRGYHILPERLNSKISSDELKNKYVFYEKERLAYMKSKIDFQNKTVLDIGCNTGYFLFDLLDSGA